MQVGMLNAGAVAENSRLSTHRAALTATADHCFFLVYSVYDFNNN